MLGTHKLIIDEWAEVWDLLKSYTDANFWQWPTEFSPTACHGLARVVLKKNWAPKYEIDRAQLPVTLEQYLNQC